MRKPSWQIIFLSANLILIYLYIFCVILNYDLTFMVYEKIRTHLWILENGKQWVWSDLAKGLNTKVIEIDPNRLSRPLSNILEVIDAKFRANLWDLIPPHPSLSLQWPFLFIGLPLLLYRFFRNINCAPATALAGTALYLTSSGFLSPIVMLDHPAKNLVNFFSILSLATITQLYRTNYSKNISIKNIPNFWPAFIGTLCCAMIAFLSDETGVFLFLILAVVTYPLLSKFKEKRLLYCCFFSLPVLYFIIIRFFLPWLHYIVNHENISLDHYRDYPSITNLFLPNWHDLLTNFYLLFAAHPNLKWNFSPLLGHPFLISLQCVYTLGFLSLSGMFIYTLYKTKKLSARLKQILAGAVLLIVFVFFHTFQLSHNVRVWTVFWYGCLFSLIYYTTLTLILQFLWEEFKGNIFKTTMPFLILIFTAHGLMTSTYIFRIFKYQNQDPRTFHYPDIFAGRVNPYQYFNLFESLKRSQCRYAYTLLYWANLKHKNIASKPLYEEAQACSPIIDSDPYFQADVTYFIVEMAYQFPVGRSFLNDPDYVNTIIRLPGEPP